MANLIIGLILIAASSVIYIIKTLKDDDDLDWRLPTLWLCAIWGGLFISLWRTIEPKHTEKFTVRTEVRQEYVNGQEVLIDTIYYFERK